MASDSLPCPRCDGDGDYIDVSDRGGHAVVAGCDLCGGSGELPILDLADFREATDGE